MSPEQFEERLGSFLRFTQSLPNTAMYPRAGFSDPSANSREIEHWFEQAATTSKQVTQAIYASLHELFGSARVSPRAAAQAYEPLLTLLQAERLTYATTNYDVAGEIALDELGRRPYAGEDVGWSATEARVLHFDDIFSDDTRRTPVLHLHGRVGWYRTADNQVFSAPPDATYIAERGAPALLLPDPSKVYDDFVSESIWQQFSAALGQATHVLVLGHSLNDPQLRATLQQVPDNKLAVTIRAKEGATYRIWDGAQSAIVESLGRSPHVIPIDFGPRPCASRQRIDEFLTGAGAQYNEATPVESIAND
jgi:hypothetical protein